MKAKGTKVTSLEKKKMWELYQQLGSYAKVAKKLRRSRDTVAKYVLEYESNVKLLAQLTEISK